MGHNHSQVSNTHKEARKTVYFGIFGSLCLALIKGLSGVFGNSYALIADATESLTDVFSSFIVLLGLRYGSRPPDKNHPYGHGRIEPLITFIVVGILLFTAVFIAKESIENIRNPHEGPKAWTLIVLGCIKLSMQVTYLYDYRQAVILNSTSLRAEAWHHRSDAITSVAAFIGISISLFFGEGFEGADDWAALFASIFIVYNCYKIFRPALGEILDEHTHDELEQKIRAIALEVDEIITTEKCFIRKTGIYYLVDLHAVVDGTITVREGHDISHRLKDQLMHELPELGNVLIHIEPDHL